MADNGYSGPLASLTPRQMQVLEMIACGMSSKEIARELGVVPKTVDRHVEAISEHLGTKTRVAAAMLYKEAASASWVELPMGTTRLAVGPASSADQDPADLRRDHERSWWSLPKLGGERRKRSFGEIGFDTLKVSAFGLIILLALLLLATGLMHFFA